MDPDERELIGVALWNRLPKRLRWTPHNMIGHPLSELAWLDDINESDAKDWPNHAAAAVDRLLATYWP